MPNRENLFRQPLKLIDRAENFVGADAEGQPR